MNTLKEWALNVLAVVFGVICGVAGFLCGLLVYTLAVAVRAIPYLILAVLLLWLCTGCVYQPIHIEAYIPSTAVIGGDVVLDAHKETLNDR